MIGGRGKDDPKDYQEALKWWRMAADQGFAPAQASLGLMYYDGQGVPKDYVLAYMWINLAPSNSTEEDVREQSGKMRDKIYLDNGSQLLNGKGVSA